MLCTRAATKAGFSSALRIERRILSVAALRQFSSQESSSRPTVTQNSTKYNSTVLLFTSLAAGLVGFTVASSVPNLLPPAIKDHGSESTQFGSSGHFKKAIQELQSTFPVDNKVSTDLDDLHSHGFSEDVYHPGMYMMKRKDFGNNLVVV